MAILQRVAFYPQERLDLPDARAIESFSQNDWRYFIKGVLSSKSYILSGFEITNYTNIFVVPGVKLKFNNVTLLHGEATTQAAGFYVSAGNEPDNAVVLNPSAVNFVEVELTDLLGTQDVRAFWDPGANGNEGAEYTDSVDTVINLNLNIFVNVSSFTPGRIPLYKMTTNAQGVVTSVTDCRPLFFRLGSGGTSPDPSHNSSNLPLENPNTSTAATATNIPSFGGDKNIKNQKEWMDYVMTSIMKLKGVPYWYMPAISNSEIFQNSSLLLFVGGSFVHEGHFATVSARTNTTISTQANEPFNAGPGQLSVGGNSYSFTSYSLSNGKFSGVSPNVPSSAVGQVVTSPLPGLFTLQVGSTIFRLGKQNNCSLSAFSSLDLTNNPVMFVILPDDAAVNYVMGNDGTTPVSPRLISAISTSSITVATGGNYITTGGNILIRGQSFSYASYTPGTGLFSGLSPDPSGLAQVNDYIYQDINGVTGYYHYGQSACVPNVKNGVSSGAEKTIWIGYFDGTNTIHTPSGNLNTGEQIQVGINSSQAILNYIGSTGQGDSTPIYNVNSIPNGTNLTEAISVAFGILETPIYDEIITDVGGTGFPNTTIINMPPNSRAGLAPAFYTIGTAELTVFENGVFMRPGYDYTEVSNQSIQLLRDVPVGSYIRFRIANLGGASSAAGAGNAQTGSSLQSAYANGNNILTTPGNPVIIDGPTGEKLLEINGDIKVTGLIDPTGLQFDPIALNPFPLGQVGLWVDNTAERLQYTRPDGTILHAGDILERLAGQDQQMTRTYLNNSGATIPAGAPVYISSPGQISLANAGDPIAYVFLGIAASSIPNGQSGLIIYQGIVPGIFTGMGFNSGYIWLGSTPGALQLNQPTDFGDYLVIIGLIDGNDLILQPQLNGRNGDT